MKNREREVVDGCSCVCNFLFFFGKHLVFANVPHLLDSKKAGRIHSLLVKRALGVYPWARIQHKGENVGVLSPEGGCLVTVNGFDLREIKQAQW